MLSGLGIALRLELWLLYHIFLDLDLQILMIKDFGRDVSTDTSQLKIAGFVCIYKGCSRLKLCLETAPTRYFLVFNLITLINWFFTFSVCWGGSYYGLERQGGGDKLAN